MKSNETQTTIYIICESHGEQIVFAAKGPAANGRRYKTVEMFNRCPNNGVLLQQQQQQKPRSTPPENMILMCVSNRNEK